MTIRVLEMSQIFHLLNQIVKAAGWFVVFAVPVVLVTTWLNTYVGSERITTIFDTLSEDHHLLAREHTTLYCNYLTFRGIRTRLVEESGTTWINGRVVHISCPWFFPRRYRW